MNSKYIKFLTVALILFAINSAFGQETFSFKSWEGKWNGTLEYLDYSSNERVKLKTFVVVKPSAEGTSAEIFTTYDDFGKVLENGETKRIDLAAKKFYEGKSEFSIESIEDGKIVLLGSGQDGENIEPFRKTITFSDDSLTILKETRTPWKFRNQLILKKIKNDSYEEKVFSVKELKEDFAVLKRALVELFPGLYRYNKPLEMAKKFDAFESKLNKPLTESEFFKLFAQMLSEVKCYHTYPNPLNQSDEVKSGLFNRRNYFPFYFEMIGRKMIVTEDASSKYLSQGSEITKINGVPMEEVVEQLLTATYADGKGTTEHRLKTLEQKRFDAERDSIFDMIFPLFFPPKDDVYKIEAIDFKTKKKTGFEVLAMTKAERDEEMAKRYGKSPTYDDGWKFEILDDKTAYLKMDHFQTWRLNFKIEPFLADAFAQLGAKNIKNLIIDIRGSGGGFDGVYRETFRYLTKKPIPCNSGTKFYFNSPKADAGLLKYASSWDPSFKENLAKGYPESMYKKADNGLFELIDDSNPCKPYQPYENNFQGKTYLLVSSKNASAAFTLPYFAKKYNLATLVGQETGGNLRGFNGSLYLSSFLPNSKFELDMSLLASVIDPNAEDSGIKPDVYVEQQPEDVGNNFDSELEKAKELIKKSNKR